MQTALDSLQEYHLGTAAKAQFARKLWMIFEKEQVRILRHYLGAERACPASAACAKRIWAQAL
jgi:hypothetical protein